MPTYLFECEDPACRGRGKALRTLAARNDPLECSVCRRPMTRLFSSPMLITERFLDREENRRGLAEIDAHAAVEDRCYARNWDKHVPNLS